MDRRMFISGMTLGLLTAPLVAEAQEAAKVYRIGVLETTSVALNTVNLDGLRQGLRELGYVEGRNFVIEYRSADGRPERFAALATDLARQNVDLILTRGTPAVQAAKRATDAIPIVMLGSGDALGSGVVAGLAHPGGNVTGLTSIDTDIIGKRLELLKQAIPRIRRIAVLQNMSNSAVTHQWRVTEVPARSLGLQVQLVDVRRFDDLERGFDTATRHRVEAVVIGLGGLMQANLPRVVDLAAKHRLPAMYPSREFVDAGGLFGYGVSYPGQYRRAASYVDKILKGAKPADLPVEQPTKYELVINLKTAKALGLTISPSLLLRADQVIE